EMGWTVDGVAHSAWQAVTPTEQAGYLLDAFAIARRDWPWLELITVWNLGGEENPVWRGYSLLDAEGRPRPAYTALQGFLQSADWASQRETRQEPQPLDRYQVLAEDVTIHLGDAEMPLPWAPLHAGRNPSPHWEGTVYVVEPGQAD